MSIGLDWSEIRAHLKASFASRGAKATETMLVRASVRGRIQVQNVDVAVLLGAPWLRIMSYVGRRDSMSAVDVLEHNLKLVVGGQAHRTSCPPVALVPCSRRSEATRLDQAAEAIADEAARPGAHGLTGRGSSGALLGHYAD